MKTARVFGLVVCVLLVGTAGAQTKTIRQTLNYTSNDWGDGPWFVEPGAVLDHSPFYRTAFDDWGWTHNIQALAPSNALSIESATLTVIAWNVEPNELAMHVLYVTPAKLPAATILQTGTRLGPLKDFVAAPTTIAWPSAGQRLYYNELWSSTTFELPANVLDTLWTTGQMYVWMNIDELLTLDGGFRVTVLNATLSVKYVVSGTVPATPVPVHRFWSPVLSSHFYTIKEGEKQKIIDNYPTVWTYEGVAYRALAEEGTPDTLPVYRFWSPVLNGHFYTISEAEKAKIVAQYPDVWTFEGIAFYAFPPGQQPEGTHPVYRFWSDVLSHHFYTIDEAEKQLVIDTYPDVWTYEGVAWYAYAP
jgi:hypothetical protein